MSFLEKKFSERKIEGRFHHLRHTYVNYYVIKNGSPAKPFNILGQEESEALLLGIREKNKIISACCVVKPIPKPRPHS